VIGFGNQTTAGTYTVVATNSTTSCTSNMGGSATISINARPTGVIFGTQSICVGGSATLTLTVTGSGTNHWHAIWWNTVQRNCAYYKRTRWPGFYHTYTIATLSDANVQQSALIKPVARLSQLTLNGNNLHYCDPKYDMSR